MNAAYKFGPMELQCMYMRWNIETKQYVQCRRNATCAVLYHGERENEAWCTQHRDIIRKAMRERLEHTQI